MPNRIKCRKQETPASRIERVKGNVVPALNDRYREASLRANDAYDWAAPRVRDGVNRGIDNVRHGIDTAGPRLENKIGEISPKVDRARDALVDDYIPRLQRVSSAAGAAASAAFSAASTAGKAEIERGRADVLKAAQKPAKKCGFGRKAGKGLLIVAAIGGLAAVGYVVWRKTQPVEDPWAPPADFARAHYPVAADDDSEAAEVADSVGGAEAGDVADSLGSEEKDDAPTPKPSPRRAAAPADEPKSENE